ncbi:MAG: hypothetical protein ABIE70_08135 [bacterium]
MSSQRTLKSLEIILESFLTRAVALKQPRLAVLESLDQLDNLARSATAGQDVTDDVADWIAKRRDLVAQNRLRPGDVDRIEQMLDKVSDNIKRSGLSSPAHRKVSQAISGWHAGKSEKAGSLVLKRQAEEKQAQESSIALFGKTLQKVNGIFLDTSDSRRHLLSVLDETLIKATVQHSREALLLSALIIYYLRQGNYKVSPYLKRLKEAEKILKEIPVNA